MSKEKFQFFLSHIQTLKNTGKNFCLPNLRGLCTVYSHYLGGLKVIDDSKQHYHLKGQNGDVHYRDQDAIIKLPKITLITFIKGNL